MSLFFLPSPATALRHLGISTPAKTLAHRAKVRPIIEFV